MRPVTVRIMHPEAGPERRPARSVAGGRACPAGAAARRRLRARRARRTSRSWLGAARRAGVRRAASGRSSRAERPAGLVVLGSGAIPLATRRDLRDLVDAAAGSDDRVALDQQPLLGGRHRGRRATADARPTCRTCRPTTPCRAGSPRSPATTVADLRRRWRLGSRHRRPARPRPHRRAGGATRPSTVRPSTPRARERLAAVRAVAARPGRRAPRRRPDLGRRRSPGWSARRRRARGRSSRSAACGRASRASGRRPRSSARCSSATDRRRSGATWRRLG